MKSASYFKRFCSDFSFCIKSDFQQVYATSNAFSWTNASEFERFCKSADIRCEKVPVERYFKKGLCDGAFLTTEYTYDARILRDYFLDEIAALPNVKLFFGCRPKKIEKTTGTQESWEIITSEGTIEAPFLLNATYASVNNIHRMAAVEPFDIKYELCEIILCETSSNLAHTGITVMDGPFFSVMPFGKTGMHSLTSVTFTPHETSYELQPAFPCMESTDGECKPASLENCNACPFHPQSAWPYMSQLARKYLREDFHLYHKSSLFSIKPILKASEVDDSRPTVIRIPSRNPTMVSVLSGKINTVYDLDEYLDNDFNNEVVEAL